MLYWNSVPAGKWSITDITDALDALSDPESVYYLARNYNRIHVFGPDKKSLLILLDEINKKTPEEDLQYFRQELLKKFGIDI